MPRSISLRNSSSVFSFLSSVLLLFNLRRIISWFARKVAVSSDLGAVVDEGEEEQHNFSPELKLFEGNLPFDADSAALAELFGRSGNVQMVEYTANFSEEDPMATPAGNSSVSVYENWKLSQHGHGVEEAMMVFHQIQKDPLLPDRTSYTRVLIGCSHCGFVEEGKHNFLATKKDSGISPGPEHFPTMIDLYAPTRRTERSI